MALHIDQTIPGTVDEATGVVTFGAASYGVLDEAARRVLPAGARCWRCARRISPGVALWRPFCGSRRERPAPVVSSAMSQPDIEGTDRAFAFERRALFLSMACGLGLAALGIAVGVWTGSQIILFDGFYTFLGIGLSVMALRASRMVACGPMPRYPFGREALTPLIIGFEGVALLATCIYASTNAVLVIVEGGTSPPSRWGVAYAACALVASVALAWTLRRDITGSELVAAEATQWLAGGMLGLGMLVAFVGARLIEGSHWSNAVRYVDPVRVLIACGLFVIPPVRMIRTTYLELLEGSPDDAIKEPVRRTVEAVSAEFGLGDHHLRMTKLGRKLYVEIAFVVPPDWQVGASDRVRHALVARLDVLPHDLWLTAEFTADPAWAE